MVKLCYQAAHGPEHILEDAELARTMLEKEIEETSPCEAPLYEFISKDYARVNISAWKKHSLAPQWLFEMFRCSAGILPGADKRMEEYLQRAGTVAEKYWNSEWRTYLESYKKAGMKPVHHSESYRAAEQPAYRVVKVSFIRILPVLEQIAKTKNSPCVIAIDGRAASGKTTMADDLAQVLRCDVVHMDDFFLPPKLRTEERLSQAGGNIHYERFAEEVLPGLTERKGFTYRVFDCGKLDYERERTINSADHRIVEGSYSLHPKFGNYAHVRVFSSIDKEKQLKRIFERDGNVAFECFKNKWLPMEEQYFATFRIADKCTVRV